MVMDVYIGIAVIVAVAAIILYRKRREKTVAQGLQVFDADGELVFDVNDYAFEVYGIVTTTAKVAGSVSDSRIKKSTCVLMLLSAKHPNFDYDNMSADDYYNEQMFSALPNFTITNGKISWDSTYKIGSNPSGYNVTFAYGGPST